MKLLFCPNPSLLSFYLHRHVYKKYTYITAIHIYTDNMTGVANLEADHERLGKTTAQ
jgi:hypothetical protein